MIPHVASVQAVNHLVAVFTLGEVSPEDLFGDDEVALIQVSKNALNLCFLSSKKII